MSRKPRFGSEAGWVWDKLFTNTTDDGFFLITEDGKYVWEVLHFVHKTLNYPTSEEVEEFLPRRHLKRYKAQLRVMYRNAPVPVRKPGVCGRTSPVRVGQIDVRAPARTVTR